MPDVSTEVRHASVVIKAIADSLKAADVLRYVGQNVAIRAQNAAYEKPGRRFWREIGDSVNTQRGEDGSVTVGATHEAAGHKQFGGQISAPGKGPGTLGSKALTIPMGVAREKRWTTRDAMESYDLFKVKTKAGRSFLFGKSKTSKKAKAVVLFTLRKSVMQQAEPWFPMGTKLQAAIAEGIDIYMKKGGL